MNNHRTFYEEIEELGKCFDQLGCVILQSMPFSTVIWFVDRLLARRRACICLLISECALAIALMIANGIIK
jgi:hypothetical protein